MRIENQTPFQIELEKLINKFSLENDSDTPDWILARYLVDCLKAFNSVFEKKRVLSLMEKK